MKMFPWCMHCVNLMKSLLHLRQSLCVISVHDTNLLLQQLTGGTQPRPVLTPRPTSTPEHAMRPCGTLRDWGLGTAASVHRQASVAPTSPSRGLSPPWPGGPCGSTSARPWLSRAGLPPSPSPSLPSPAQPQAGSSLQPCPRGTKFSTRCSKVCRSGACLACVLRRPQITSDVEGGEKVLKIQMPGQVGLLRQLILRKIT